MPCLLFFDNNKHEILIVCIHTLRGQSSRITPFRRGQSSRIGGSNKIRIGGSNLSEYPCNVHWRCQLHPFERRNDIKLDYLIDLKNSFKQIPILEQDCGLKNTGKQHALKF